MPVLFLLGRSKSSLKHNEWALQLQRKIFKITLFKFFWLFLCQKFAFNKIVSTDAQIKTDYKCLIQQVICQCEGLFSLLQYCTSSYNIPLCTLPTNKSIHQETQVKELVFWNGFWSSQWSSPPSLNNSVPPGLCLLLCSCSSSPI